MNNIEDMDNVQVPRDLNIGNKGVTKDIENFLFDLIADNPNDAFHVKELFAKVVSKFASKYGDNLLAHTAWALNMLAFNRLAKRVAPGTWESVDGPDDEIERIGGYAPEGEFARRSYKVYSPSTSKEKQDFRNAMEKSELSVKMLKNTGKSKDEVISILSKEKGFHPVAVKLAVKKLFLA